MNNDLQKAIQNLENHSIVCVKDEAIIINDRNGISPLMYLIANNVDLKGYSMADAFVGKATALLANYVGIKEIYTPTISQSAIDYLKTTNIQFHYDHVVAFILNRKKDGPCIMEQTIKDVNDCNQAYELLKNKLIRIYGRSYE